MRQRTYFYLLPALLLLLLGLPSPGARAQQFDFSQDVFMQHPGDVFSLTATLFNNSGSTFTVDNLDLFQLTGMPLNIGPGQDLDFSFTGSIFGDYAPGETHTDTFSFTLGNSVPSGDYSFNTVASGNGNGIAQHSIALNVSPSTSPAPEFGSLFSLTGLLAIGGYGFWRQRHKHLTERPEADKKTL